MTPSTERWKWVLATCGGAGYSPILPGTLGAVWGVAIYAAIGALVPAWHWQSLAIAVALLAACGVTLALSRWAEAFFGEEDSSRFVTDEVVGFLFAVLLFRTPQVWTTVLWVFPLVRIIDIIKVPPARSLERLPGGWGVLADDLLASIYTALLLHGIRWLVPAWFV